MKVNIGRFLKTKDQRISVEIEPHDTYGFDTTLAYIILPGLIQLRDSQHGIPSEFSTDDFSGQQVFEFYEKDEKEAFEDGVHRWKEVLDKMIWSFQQIIEDNYREKYHHGEMEWEWEETDELLASPLTGGTCKGFKLIDLNPNDHWVDIEGIQAHDERIQEGLELFGKYYRNLWD
jgi:hypothetical protein